MSSTAPASPSSAVFTIPNAISALRLLGVPVFVWLVIGLHADVLALLLLMASGITDWADGFLARRLGQISTLGSILDPVADRLYILAVVVGLAWRDFVPWWMVIVLPLRDVLLWALVPFLRSRGYSALPVHYLGKAATFCLLYAFPLLFIARGHGNVSTVAEVLGWAFAVWGIGLYWCAGVIYALQVRRLLRESEPKRDAFAS
ncbi:MAG: CDP-alcohol phosphatidyltransferase family protein [Marmoricola sp.]